MPLNFTPLHLYYNSTFSVMIVIEQTLERKNPKC